MNDCIRVIVASVTAALLTGCAGTHQPHAPSQALRAVPHAEPGPSHSACHEASGSRVESDPDDQQIEGEICQSQFLLQRAGAQNREGGPALAESVELPETPIPVPRGVGGVGILY